MNLNNPAMQSSPSGQPDADDVIVTRALTRSFPMGDTVIRALQGVDVTIRRGEYVAIMGPSGSGKSTLMNIIGCLDRPDSGEYWLNGTPVADLGDGDLADAAQSGDWLHLPDLQPAGPRGCPAQRRVAADLRRRQPAGSRPSGPASPWSRLASRIA